MWRIELRQDRLRRREPRREWVGIIIDRAPEKLGKGGRLVVGKIEHHNASGYRMVSDLDLWRAANLLIREHGMGAELASPIYAQVKYSTIELFRSLAFRLWWLRLGMGDRSRRGGLNGRLRLWRSRGGVAASPEGSL